MECTLSSDIGEEQWKVLVIDEQSKKIIDNVVKEDDILDKNIASSFPPQYDTPSLGAGFCPCSAAAILMDEPTRNLRHVQILSG